MASNKVAAIITMILCLMASPANAEERKIVRVFDNLKVYGPISDMTEFDSPDLEL